MAQPDSLQVSSQVISSTDTIIFTLRGSLVISDMFELQKQLQEDNHAATIIDMAGISYLDSAGVGLLVNAYVHREKTRRKLGLVSVPLRPMTVLRVTRVDTLFRFFQSVDEARVALSGSAVGLV
ncbi:MAG: STAS domain-containing protein [Acidobacteriaceae bacterium]